MNTMSNFADRKAEAARLFEAMHDQLDAIAAVRREAREHGLELPEDIRQSILNMRRLLLEAGLPPEQIDAAPGLKLPDG